MAGELLATHLLQAAAAREERERYQFLLAVGREVARLLYGHLGRLEGILNRISPVQGEAH